MNDDLISVLVPVYDTGSWLQNCLESIAAQTYRNLEVILVDDGSADGSRETCERFCREDPRFRLISQEHLGVSAARNAALDAAQGDFIYFADADDYLSPRALEVLHAALRSGPYDMSTADFLKVTRAGEAAAPPEDPGYREFSGEDCLRECISGHDIRWMVVWNHLIPRKFFSGLRFESLFQEDKLLCYCLFRKMRRTVLVGETTYFYVDRPDSLSTRAGYLGEEARFPLYARMLELTPEEDKGCRALVLKKLYHVFLTRRYQTKGPEEKERLYAVYRPFLKKTRHEYFTHPDISIGEKAMIRFLLSCPWAVWLMMKITNN